MPPPNPEDPQSWLRWRMVLGPEAESMLGCGASGEWAERDQLLGFLYDREYGPGRNIRRSGKRGLGTAQPQDRAGNLGDSNLTVPDWINQVQNLFPKRTIERLEKDALERYEIDELVTNPAVLQRAQPNPTLLKAVLRTKHLMNQEVLAVARQLVRKVVDELFEKLARPIRSVFLGAVLRRRSPLRVAKNFDALATLRKNLKNYDPVKKRLLIETPLFFSRIRRQTDRWQIIILVDESGSMMDSVIHAAVTAAIFFGLRDVKTHLVLFDTQVVDVTAECTDPVETLMKVQLGGGTDIGQALSYAATLVEQPRRTIVVLISDFFEGAPVSHLLLTAKQLLESGVTLLGLAALDEQAEPNYDRDLAGKLVRMGAHVAAMTPGELAAWVAQKIR